MKQSTKFVLACVGSYIGFRLLTITMSGGWAGKPAHAPPPAPVVQAPAPAAPAEEPAIPVDANDPRWPWRPDGTLKDPQR